MNITIECMSVEVTRECNMKCRHCMRGDAQNKTLNLDVWEKLCKNINRIDDLNLTGGEPSLRPEIIMQMLEIAKKEHVSVGSIYVVTNAKKITTDFIMAMAAWFAYTYECDEYTAKEMNSIAISYDCYHEEIKQSEVNKIKIFDCFNDKSHNRGKSETILVQAKGRATEYVNPKYTLVTDRHKPRISCSEEEIYIYDQSISMTVDGDILTDCDYAYDDCDDIFVANVNDKMWRKRLIAACEKDD